MEVKSIIEMAAQWGIFAALFVSLFVYVVKENKIREKDYRDIIKTLGEKLHTLSSDSNEVTHDVFNHVGMIDTKVDGIVMKLEVVDKKVDAVAAKTDCIGTKLEIINHDMSKKG